MQDVGRRSDGIAAVDQRRPGLLRGGDQTQGDGLVAGHLATAPRRDLSLGDAVVDRQSFDRFAKVVAGLERPGIGLEHSGILGELIPDPLQRRFQGPIVQPEDQAQGEEIPAAVSLTLAELDVGQGRPVERGDRGLQQLIPFQRSVFQGVGGVAGLVQVGRAETIGIDDEDAAVFQVLEVRFQGGGVHGHQGIEAIARSMDVATGEVNLKPAHAGHGARRSPDFCGVVRQGADVVAQDGRSIGELGPDQLHAVSRVAGQADGGLFEFLDLSWLDAAGSFWNEVGNGHLRITFQGSAGSGQKSGCGPDPCRWL